MEGGMGLCGRPYCCATVLKHFSSVNVKMAKIQRLSLNPSSVSGGCGRLKCCLRFEVDGYREMFANMPRTGAMCETPEGPGRVLDCNALTQVVRVRLDGDGNRIADFAMDDIQDKGRSGKNRR
jgi:cell fate regulator YaaT (PSP1 superfamily)